MRIDLNVAVALVVVLVWFFVVRPMLEEPAPEPDTKADTKAPDAEAPDTKPAETR